MERCQLSQNRNHPFDGVEDKARVKELFFLGMGEKPLTRSLSSSPPRAEQLEENNG